MHILYIHQYFTTPKGKSGTRSYEFAKRWVKAGHSLIMLTTVAQLTEQDLCDSSGYFFKKVVIDGIDIRAINLPYNQKMGFAARALSFAGFVVIASFYMLFLKRPDVVYATSTPLTVGIPVMILKWLKRVPFVFEVRDQWPEIPIELGIINNSMLQNLLLWLEKRIYKSSSAIVALSPGMKEGIEKVIGQVRPITVVPNSCDTELFHPEVDGTQIRKEQGWTGKFVLLHAGAMGKVNSLDFLIDAARMLQGNEAIHFVLIGGGREKRSLEERARSLNLKNVQIMPSVPKNQLPGFFAAADISLVIIGNYPIIQHNSANKFFDSLSAGKPVLLNYSGWQRDILEKNNAGWGCELCDIEEFTKKIRAITSNTSVLQTISSNARRLAMEKFNRDKLAQQVLEELKKVTE